jgi:hypothetical protein
MHFLIFAKMRKSCENGTIFVFAKIFAKNPLNTACENAKTKIFVSTLYRSQLMDGKIKDGSLTETMLI